ncbi:fungal-specific transcription factor domain-containing protein [Xylariaceae sp. FL0662B]|nr:fungal-specific transcription factor domain-containing protein [Xylariaceae sp. FL0662B]
MPGTSSAAAVHDNSSPMEPSSGLSPNGNSTTSPAGSTPQDHSTLTNTASISIAQPATSVGPITLDPSTTPSSALNPRSCVTCRRRKVRCDKFMPCGNCRKAHIHCVFPAPGRAPRRPRIKDPNAPPKQTSEREMELMKRLRKLEGIVEDLSGQVEFETRHPSGSGGGSPETTVDNGERRKQSAHIYSENLPGGYPSAESSRPRRTQTGEYGSTALRSPGTEVQRDFGRLVLNEKGKTRYVSSAFWSKVNDEINQLRAETERLTDEDSEDSDDGSIPGTINQYSDGTDHHGFVLGYSSSNVDLRELHPLPSQIPFIWQVFIENVDPLVKILHVPSMDKIIRELRSNMQDISPGLEALMFSIYYAAITSMEDAEVKMNFNAEKAHLINKYRFATEQALAKANFLVTSELITVQAFTLFLFLVRRYDDTRFAWTLTGLAIRIAQSLGLHRDGSNFDDLSPFDIEMRRRMWWSICILDLRSAEDQGTELTIAERTYDTKFPLNVNDTDINPDMTEMPEERRGTTDMTFCLIRYEICSLTRRMHSATNGIAPCPRDSQCTLEQREIMLMNMYEHIEEKYLKVCGDKDTDLLHWVAATIARLIMAKMSLITYQPVLMSSTALELSEDARDRLFMASVEVVEYTKVLNTEPKCRQWRWLFQTYTQWHAVAYLLIELCRRPWTASVERAFGVLNATFQAPNLAQRTTPGVWIPLRKLLLKARRHREDEIARLRAHPEVAQQLDIADRNKVPPASFQHLPSSVRSALAQERWRRLMGIKGPDNSPPHASCLTDSGPQAGKSVTQPQESNNSMVQSDMQYLDHVMSQQEFNAHEFFSVVFRGNSFDLARHAVFGDIQSQPPPAAGPKPGQTLPVETFSTTGAEAYPSTQSAIETPTPNEPPNQAFIEDNPPPWLWPDSWANGTPTNTTMNAPLAGDHDVNMDAEEDFNWQSWMDTGFTMGRPGFMGGI